MESEDILNLAAYKSFNLKLILKSCKSEIRNGADTAQYLRHY
jgi:hypothetical protein